MDTCIVIITNLLRVALCTTTAIMDTPLLETVSEDVKPMEHGQVKNQHVVSMIVYGLRWSKLNSQFNSPHLCPSLPSQYSVYFKMSTASTMDKGKSQEAHPCLPQKTLRKCWDHTYLAIYTSICHIHVPGIPCLLTTVHPIPQYHLG